MILVECPTPPRDLMDVKIKELGKGVRIFVITKGNLLGFATDAERAFGGVHPRGDRRSMRQSSESTGDRGATWCI